VDEEPGTARQAAPDRLAVTTAKSLSLTGTVSSLLLVGAGLAVLIGIVGAIATYSATNMGTNLGDVLTMDSGMGINVSQTLGFLLSSLLPAGLLAAAGVALRLQAARLEVAFLEN